MNEIKRFPPYIIKVIRWTARVWSIASFGFVVLMVVGEIVLPHAPAPSGLRDWVGLLLFPVGVCVGMAVGWRWQGIGGGIAVACLIAFYAALRLWDGRFPPGPYFVLVAAPGILFLLCWLLSCCAVSIKKCQITIRI